MKHGKKILHGTLLISVLGLSVGAPGCNSCSSGKTTNPFAMDRQTVPPPATFSTQPSYLGQTPGTYTPQAPATVFPQGTAAPASTPTTPAVVSPSPYGSINGGGATTFQSGSVPTAQLATTAAPMASEWKAANPAPADVAVPDAEAVVASTPQTAFQYMESKVGTVSTVSDDGRSQSVTTAPESLVVSSSQTITKISGEATPVEEPAPAEPQPLYKGW